jgi:aminoglycoside phosphotransferase (APT) family kinase protein
MATGFDANVATRIERALAERLECAVTVRAVQKLAGGACQENLVVDLDVPAGPLSGPRRWVLRSDAASSLAGSIARRDEFPLIQRVREEGVATPDVFVPAEGLLHDRASSYFMEYVPGIAIAREVLQNPGLAGARERLPEQLAEQLVRIHAVEPSEGLLGGIPDQAPAARALGRALAQVVTLPEPHPALTLAIAWLGERPPPAAPVRLVHGDYRLGNFLVNEAGLAAVLDWEFAHFGDPAEDVAWLSLREWRFGAKKVVAGLCDRDTFLRLYEQHGGRAIDKVALRWWEIFFNVWWAIGCVGQYQRYRDGSVRDFELLAIGRRAAEMEWEALRLIERTDAISA